MKTEINPYLKVTIKNEMLRADTFLKLCEAAAMKDDGVVTKEEQEIIKKLKKAMQEYVKSLEKIMG